MRIAYRMKVHPGQHAEYERRHNPIWPELEAMLKDHGVQSYSIYLDDATGDLFAFVEIESLERWQAIPGTAICRKWWAHNEPLMEYNADCTPATWELREVFHIE
jgi:L-rhamnose mutarotase